MQKDFLTHTGNVQERTDLSNGILFGMVIFNRLNDCIINRLAFVLYQWPDCFFFDSVPLPPFLPT